MNLGELIERLENIPDDLVFPNGFGEPMSWRGVYAELAFNPENNVTAGSMLENAKSAVGKTFTGYKGGDFMMTLDTDVHIASYGSYGGDEDAITKWRWDLMVMQAKYGDVK